MAKAKTITRPSDDEETVQLVRKRFARRQRARRWLAWRGAVAAVLAVALVAGVIWLMFFSPVLAVSGVTVEGTSVLSTHEVRRAADVPRGEPLARVNLAAIAARVEDLALVKSVDVSRAWPDKVRIDITERVAVAVVERDGVIRGLDEDGVLFRRYPSAPVALPVVHMGAKTRAEALAEAAQVVRSLPSELAAKIDYIEVGTIDTISLRMRNGRTIMWGSAEDSENKAKIIAVLLRQRASVYDVSVPGRPTIRP